MRPILGLLMTAVGAIACAVAPAAIVYRFHEGTAAFDSEVWSYVVATPLVGLVATYYGLHLVMYSEKRSPRSWRMVQRILGTLALSSTLGILGWALIVGAVTIGQVALVVMTMLIGFVAVVLFYLSMDAKY